LYVSEDDPLDETQKDDRSSEGGVLNWWVKNGSCPLAAASKEKTVNFAGALSKHKPEGSRPRGLCKSVERGGPG